MAFKINLSKNMNKISVCNYDVLQKIFRAEPCKTESDEPRKKNQEGEWEWRSMPTCDMEMMLISSYGDEFIPLLDAVPKLLDNAVEANERLILARKELDAILDKCRVDNGVMLKYFCTDFPGAQFPKHYYIDRVKQFFEQCDKDGAVLWYTGHGERSTGNWCFKDGVITLDDIFGLYMHHFRGKRLTVVSDCSYSGKWISDCVKKMDEIGIPSCGHHAREQGILLKVFSSCQENEEATIGAYSKATGNNEKKGTVTFSVKQLDSGQNACCGDFRHIYCRKKASEQCEISSNSTWEDRIINCSLVYLVRGTDKERPAWYYVLVDKAKQVEFKIQLKADTINLEKFGKILNSGYGNGPPEDVTTKIKRKFGVLNP